MLLYRNYASFIHLKVRQQAEIKQIPKADLQGKVSKQEWQTRIDRAGCYRLIAMQGSE